MGRIGFVEDLAADCRHTLRSLLKSPGFTLVVVLLLALGIGANTAIFSLLNALLFQVLPVAGPQQLVQFENTVLLWDTGGSDGKSRFGYPEYEFLSANSKSFSGIFAGTGVGRINVEFRGTAGIAEAVAYTENVFSVLGLRPDRGRLFLPGEDRAAAQTAVISHRYWRNRFAGDPSIIGRTARINRVPFAIVGVTPPEFSGLSAGFCPDVWIPLGALERIDSDPKRWTDPFLSWLRIAGRLRPHVSQAEAQAEVDVARRQFLADQLKISGLQSQQNVQNFVHNGRLILTPAATGLGGSLRTRYRRPLELLLALAGIALLVACANVATLLLARSSTRQRDVAICLALGASRGRVVRQFLLESMLLALGGGVFAVFVAWWGSLALVRVIYSGESWTPLVVAPDWRVFSFAAGASLITGIVLGLMPALRGAHISPNPALKEGALRGGRSARSLYRWLVIVEIALSVIVITGAGLFVGTLRALWGANVGYDRQNVLMFSVDAGLAGYRYDRAGAVYGEILRKMQELPAVKAAAASVVRPVDDEFSLFDRLNEIDGVRIQEREAVQVAWNAISPNYFQTVSTPILSGRDFDDSDNERAPEVAIVNELLARKVFPNKSALGHYLGNARVVGIVRDAKYEGPRDEARPVLYYPLFQSGPSQAFRWGYVSFELRYRSYNGLLDEVRNKVTAVDPTLPIFRAETLLAQTGESLLTEHLLALISSFFGALVLVVACVGLWGLMAYSVSRRTNEIGIRMALGARPRHLMWLLVGESMLITCAGIACGMPLALMGARLADAVLFGAKAADSLIPAILILAGTSILASAIPASRVLRIDPILALRRE